MFKKKKPLLALISLALSATVLLSACGTSTSSPAAQDTKNNTAEKNVHFIYNFSTSSLDPHVDSSYVPLRAGLTETLLRLDEDNLTVAPWLAESWESKDGQHWTINLRDNVTFQNGKPMTGEAVKASLERALKENVAIQNTLKIDTIKADGNKLEITTIQPFPEFASELVNPNTAVIDVSEPDIVNKPVGTGPFKLTSFTPGSKLELERYDTYWDGG